jgi:hypothetical protein
MKENNESTWKRINELSKTLNISVKWECELNRELKNNEEMAKFFSDLANDKGPINPRDAYFGGRVG